MVRKLVVGLIHIVFGIAFALVSSAQTKVDTLSKGTIFTWGTSEQIYTSQEYMNNNRILMRILRSSSELNKRDTVILDTLGLIRQLLSTNEKLSKKYWATVELYYIPATFTFKTIRDKKKFINLRKKLNALKTY